MNREIPKLGMLTAEDNIVGWIYIIRCGRFYKIGWSTKPNQRFYTISSSLPFKTEFIHRIGTDNPVLFEAELHERYAKKRTRGEWFRLSVCDVEELRSMTQYIC